VQAWNALSSKHGKIAAMLMSADSGKAVLYAGAPAELQAKLKANEWLTEALKVMGGKGGGKPGVAQGQAAEVERVSQAAEAAEHFAAMKLA